MIEAHVDVVDPSGLIDGWAADWTCQAPCHVRIVSGSLIIAEAVADTFRYDLLRGKVGHGHYAYSVWPRADIAPGDYEIEILEPVQNRCFPAVQKTLTVIQPPMRPATTVEGLLSRRLVWTDAQVLCHLSCLQLTDNMEAMGIERFVDVTYQFVLNRWADAVGAPAYVANLTSGHVLADEFFRELMLSPERQAIGRPLPSPFDSRFPYHLSYFD